MDVVKFYEEFDRMCKSYKECAECPMHYEQRKTSYNCRTFLSSYYAISVPIVEKWSKKHPIATNWEKFQEVFGTAIDPVTATVDWWSAEYKEPKGEQNEN